jgi:hypothetical protein
MTVVRSALAVLAGILVVSLLVEPLEFGLVALLNGAPTFEPTEYLAIRNQTWFLAAKFGYNGAAGVVGGYISGTIAGRRPVLHASVTAAVQILLIAVALMDANMARTAPTWAWVGILLATSTGLVAGGWLRLLAHRNSDLQ